MSKSGIDWEQINFDEFELITFCLLEAMGFDQPKRLSGPGDQGEDLVAFQPPYFSGIPVHGRKWVFQCKKVKSLKKVEILEELANFASQKIDTWVLVCSYDPSPAFQRWFQSLEQTQRHPFHIQAWWRNEVEHLIRTHSDYLKKTLPDTLIPKLNLKAGKEQLDGSYEAVVAKLRLLADAQIERFARGKYIPKLYVRRSLQQELSKFLIPDAKLCASAKATLITFLEMAISQLEHYPEKFANRTVQVDKDLKALLEQRSKVRDTHEIDETIKKKKEQLTRRREIDGSAKRLLSEWLNQLRIILRAANKLHDDSYFRHRAAYDELFARCRSFVIGIDDKLREFRPAPEETTSASPASLDSEKSSKRRPELEMLADDSFIFNYKERFDSEIRSVERSLRSALVVVDRAGGGKTNLICELVRSWSSEQPVIVLFGKANFPETDGLTKTITEFMAKSYATSNSEVADAFDRLLENEEQFLTVLIDGINENRRISALDASIESLLEWTRSKRIRVIITCRDIYWSFFSFDNWSHNVQRVIREKLNQFSATEYDSALPLYLEHYNINCNLAETAKDACHHPLLLRFFCEAYGSIEGPVINLGDVYDIRLKELFDVYLHRKTEQIRKSMGHRNADLIYRYLLNLVAFLFKNSTTAISTIELEEATGEADTSTQNSLYLHLLDEDIIIEEQPTDELEVRRVGFVYEEFMEYLLASSILRFKKRFGVSNVQDIFEMLNASLGTWVNARGVGEYTALMLLGLEHEHSRTDAISFMRMMVRSGPTWTEAFWSVVGKCSENQLRADLFDEFYSALDALTHVKTITKTLTAMSRFDLPSSHKLAAIILWSSALPKVVTWSEINSLPTMNEIELEAFTNRLYSLLKQRKFSRPPGKITYRAVIEAVLPFLDSVAQTEIEESLRKYGMNVAEIGGRAFLFNFWKHFPEHGNFLLNGIFSSDEGVRSFCADRLRFTKNSRSQISAVCLRLAEAERNPEIRQTLFNSGHVLQKGH